MGPQGLADAWNEEQRAARNESVRTGGGHREDAHPRGGGGGHRGPTQDAHRPHRGPTQDTHRHAPTERSRWTLCVKKAQGNVPRVGSQKKESSPKEITPHRKVDGSL